MFHNKMAKDVFPKPQQASFARNQHCERLIYRNALRI